MAEYKWVAHQINNAQQKMNEWPEWKKEALLHQITSPSSMNNDITSDQALNEPGGIRRTTTIVSND